MIVKWPEEQAEVEKNILKVGGCHFYNSVSVALNYNIWKSTTSIRQVYIRVTVLSIIAILTFSKQNSLARYFSHL